MNIGLRKYITSFFPGPGNVDDRDEGVTDRPCRELWGKLFGEGEIYITGIVRATVPARDKTDKAAEKEYENRLMEKGEKVLIRRGAVIESVNDFLKNICRTGHRRTGDSPVSW
jgi:hypothetical protein